MHLYTETLPPGNHANVSFYTAIEAYHRMGFEIIPVSNLETLEIQEDHIFLGSIEFMHRALGKLGLEVPDANDYPDELRYFLKRKVWSSTINTIAADPDHWNVFVKPKTQKKKFVGRLVTSTKDLIACGDLTEDVAVWVSEPLNFVAEWRVFIRYGTVLGVRPYRGDWRAQFDAAIIEAAVAAFSQQPAGYALDFGLTDQGELALIEFNDGYSLGNYGLFYVDYAKLLAARWAELSGQRDLCYF